MSTNTLEKTITITMDEINNIPEPTEFAVILHNNDQTPFQSVVLVLETVFKIEARKAYDIMMQAHKKGYSVCLISSQEICEDKKLDAEDYCRMMSLEMPYIDVGGVSIPSYFNILRFEVVNINDL